MKVISVECNGNTYSIESSGEDYVLCENDSILSIDSHYERMRTRLLYEVAKHKGDAACFLV